jgi:DNA-binding MarR family transcriptional regulator
MSRPSLPYFEENTDPLAARIATGLHKLGLAMKQQTWHQASEEGLSATQGQILAALSTHGALTGTELGARLGVTLPTISDSVRALVDKGSSPSLPIHGTRAPACSRSRRRAPRSGRGRARGPS